MRSDDGVRLRHMLDAAREAVSFIQGKSRSRLEMDRELTLALVKCIEIVGEAANRVTKKRRYELQEIPWPYIISMRNRLIHAYFDIDLDILWNTVTLDLPPLIAELEKNIPHGHSS